MSKYTKNKKNIKHIRDDSEGPFHLVVTDSEDETQIAQLPNTSTDSSNIIQKYTLYNISSSQKLITNTPSSKFSQASSSTPFSKISQASFSTPFSNISQASFNTPFSKISQASSSTSFSKIQASSGTSSSLITLSTLANIRIKVPNI
jgi:hypothetical protein